ncbi:MAG: hypothetical protein ABEI74_04730 [Candidatus Pacearchaeota archaeon]
MQSKKGALGDVFVWIVVAIVTLTFIGLWVYGHGLITDQITSTNSNMVNEAANKTFGEADRALNGSGKTLAFIILIGMAINAMISNFLVRSHPAFLILYIFVAAAGIVLAATVSNIYTGEILQNPDIASTFQQFTAANFVLQYLPYFAAIIALVGGIFLLINIVRDEGGPTV